tara:strand:+ start:7156 stop:8712 length:1557 start_codon:yes stop_codon:yes gene_type:complete
MKLIRNFFRFIKIKHVILKYDLLQIVVDYSNSKFIKSINFFNPWHYSKISKKYSQGVRLRLSLEELGPIFVKFGQLLSTRPDLFPASVIEELRLLQDKVKPFDTALVHKELERSYGKNYKKVFLDFNYKPIAAASIAQVHFAKLQDNTEVAVKILRPNIVKQISKDVDLLKAIVRVLALVWSNIKRFRLPEVVNEFERTLDDELDLLKEAANASQLKRNFKDSDILYIPEIHWDYCRPSILVAERISGIPISDITTLKSINTDMKVLAKRGVDIFFTQVFRDKFFHADMHSGNIFVDVSNPANPKYLAVDFGIVGSLSLEDQEYLALNFLAFLDQDYYKIAQLHVDSGWINKNTRVELFAAAIRTVCEPIFEKPLKDISFGNLLLRLFQVAQKFDMEVQPQLLLLQKTLISIEGLGRQLYPDLELWVVAKPYLQNWFKERYNVCSALEKFKDSVPDWLSLVPAIPKYIKNNLLHNSQDSSNLEMIRINNLNKINNNLKIMNYFIALGILVVSAYLFIK